DQSPEQVARRYVEPDKGVVDSAAALEGARAILVERFSEDATLIGALREEVWSRGRLCSRVRAGQAAPGAKFAAAPLSGQRAQERRVPRLREGPCRAACVWRAGRTLEHAMADENRRESQGQMGTQAVRSAGSPRSPRYQFGRCSGSSRRASMTGHVPRRIP